MEIKYFSYLAGFPSPVAIYRLIPVNSYAHFQLLFVVFFSFFLGVWFGDTNASGVSSPV